MGFDGTIFNDGGKHRLSREMTWILMSGMLEGYELYNLANATGADFTHLLKIVPSEPGRGTKQDGPMVAAALDEVVAILRRHDLSTVPVMVVEATYLAEDFAEQLASIADFLRGQAGAASMSIS